MADLDDFFAKKDKKKKGKKGSKFAKANTDILAQNLIENDKKTEDDEKKAAAMLATSEANRAGAAKENTGTDEEWDDYVEERKDFSNLKVDALKLDSGSEQDDIEIDEETGEKIRGKRVENIWKERNKLANAESRDSGNDDESPRKDINQNSEKPVEVKPKAYVPPHLKKHAQSSEENRSLQSGRSRIKTIAPDMNATNFPSLSDSAAMTNDKMKKVPREIPWRSEEKEFETARGGGNQQQRVSDAPKLITNNKFAALRN